MSITVNDLRDALSGMVTLVNQARVDSGGEYPYPSKDCICCTFGAKNIRHCAYHKAIEILNDTKQD
jgi:hypothetical protein